MDGQTDWCNFNMPPEVPLGGRKRTHIFVYFSKFVIQFVLIHSIKFGQKICHCLQEHLSPSVTLKMGVKIIQISPSLWLTIITYISLYD